MWTLAGRAALTAASAAVLMTLTACDGGASAVAARDHAAVTDLTAGTGAGAVVRTSARAASTAAIDPRTLPVRQVDGKPVWAATRTLEADAAAAANFERNGADFGVESAQAWITRVHDFVDSPPRGTQRITRGNGDTLFYDAKANVFAVATKDGAPRTMFKPTTGAAYWDQQKAQEASRLAKAKTAPADEG